MGVVERLLDRRSGGREARGFGEEMSRIPGPLDAWRSDTGEIVSPDRALHHIDVYKNISLISDAMAMLPLRAFRNVAYSGPAGVQMHATKLPRQPLLFTDPIPGDLASEFTWKHRVMSSLLTTGDTFNEVAAVDQFGFPSVMIPIDPAKVRDVRLNRGMPEFVMHDGGIMGSVRDGGTMVHWPGFIEAGKLTGLSPIAAGMKGIGLSIAAERFGGRWFGDGAHPSGYLSNKNEVTPTDAEKTKKAWVRQYSALNREPAYLYGGLEWTQLQVPPEESQFIETRQLQSAQISGLFRVPPHLVGDATKATTWGTGIEEMGIGFVVFTLGPWISRMEQAMSMLLPRGQFAKLNVSALLRGKTSERNRAYAVGRQWGWLSVNDIRAMEDLPPIPDGDTYLQPLNMIDAAQALALAGSGNNNGNGSNNGDDDV